MFDFPINDPEIPVQQRICASPLIMHCPHSDAFAAIRVHLMLNSLVWEPAMVSDGCRPMATDERKLVQCRLEAALACATAVLQANRSFLLSLAAALLDLRQMTAGEIGPHLPSGKKVKMHSEPIATQTAVPLDITSYLQDFSSLGG